MLQGTGARALGLQLWFPGSKITGAVVVADELSCPVVCRIFLDSGWKPCLLHLQAGCFTTEAPGKSMAKFFTQNDQLAKM